MWRADNLIAVTVVVGAFFCGVVWAPQLVDFSVKDALEATSYVATIVACVVAVVALLAWKAQFRHAERYATLRALKDAITDMHTYRGFLLAVKKSCDYQIANGGDVDPALRAKEIEKRQLMLSALTSYNKAWAGAVGFLTPAEEARIVGTPTFFTKLGMERPDELMRTAKRCVEEGERDDYSSAMEEFDEEAMHVYAISVAEIERLLREKV